MGTLLDPRMFYQAYFEDTGRTLHRSYCEEEDMASGVDFFENLISNKTFIEFANENNKVILADPKKYIDFAKKYSGLIK